MGTLPSTETLRVPLPHPPLVSQRTAADAAAQSAYSRLTALRHFDDVFRETSAKRPVDMEEAFRLRYQVYCLDRGFEEATDCPEGLERDRYDDEALHCLLRERAGDTPIGTVRLVRPAATPIWFRNLPVAEYAHRDSMAEIMRLPAGATAEVSRFAITRLAREILQDSAKATAHLPSTAPSHAETTRRALPGDRLLPYMSLGLIRGLVRLSVEYGITHWCLAAEPSLLRRLRNFGLHFHNAGPLVDHRGLRQVCYAELSGLLERARAEHPEFWDIITVGGFLVSDALAQTAA